METEFEGPSTPHSARELRLKIARLLLPDFDETIAVGMPKRAREEEDEEKETKKRKFLGRPEDAPSAKLPKKSSPELDYRLLLWILNETELVRKNYFRLLTKDMDFVDFFADHVSAMHYAVWKEGEPVKNREWKTRILADMPFCGTVRLKVSENACERRIAHVRHVAELAGLMDLRDARVIFVSDPGDTKDVTFCQSRANKLLDWVPMVLRGAPPCQVLFDELIRVLCANGKAPIFRFVNPPKTFALSTLVVPVSARLEFEGVSVFSPLEFMIKRFEHIQSLTISNVMVNAHELIRALVTKVPPGGGQSLSLKFSRRGNFDDLARTCRNTFKSIAERPEDWRNRLRNLEVRASEDDSVEAQRVSIARLKSDFKRLNLDSFTFDFPSSNFNEIANWLTLIAASHISLSLPENLVAWAGEPAYADLNIPDAATLTEFALNRVGRTEMADTVALCGRLLTDFVAAKNLTKLTLPALHTDEQWDALTGSGLSRALVFLGLNSSMARPRGLERLTRLEELRVDYVPDSSDFLLRAPANLVKLTVGSCVVPAFERPYVLGMTSYPATPATEARASRRLKALTLKVYESHTVPNDGDHHSAIYGQVTNHVEHHGALCLDRLIEVVSRIFQIHDLRIESSLPLSRADADAGREMVEPERRPKNITVGVSSALHVGLPALLADLCAGGTLRIESRKFQLSHTVPRSPPKRVDDCVRPYVPSKDHPAEGATRLELIGLAREWAHLFLAFRLFDGTRINEIVLETPSALAPGVSEDTDVCRAVAVMFLVARDNNARPLALRVVHSEDRISYMDPREMIESALSEMPLDEFADVVRSRLKVVPLSEHRKE